MRDHPRLTRAVTILTAAAAALAAALGLLAGLSGEAHASANPYPQYQVGLAVTYDIATNGAYTLDPATGPQADIMAVTTIDGGCTWTSAPGQAAPANPTVVAAHIRSFTTALFGTESVTFANTTGTYTFKYAGTGGLCG